VNSAKQRGLMPSTGIAAGIFASVLLSLLTLSVFYVLQDFGPESAIRKFNQAILDGDRNAEERASSQSLDGQEEQWLHTTVQRNLQAGGRLRLWQLDRHVDHPPSYVVAHVDYVFSNGSLPFIFIVTYENHVWRVNPEATLAILRQLQGARR
jgi:hypothetical protein